MCPRTGTGRRQPGLSRFARRFLLWKLEPAVVPLRTSV
jgi:hypothetical protein